MAKILNTWGIEKNIIIIILNIAIIYLVYTAYKYMIIRKILNPNIKINKFKVNLEGKNNVLILLIANIASLCINGFDINKILFLNGLFFSVRWLVNTDNKGDCNKDILRDVYRMHMYISSQYVSGNRLEDSLQEVYKLAESKKIEEIFRKASIIIYQTSDIDRAISLLKKQCVTEEELLLVKSIQIISMSNMNQTSLEKIGSLIYEKYKIYLENEVMECKKMGYKIVFIFTTIIIIMIGIPIIYRGIQATDSIFY